MCGGTVIKLNDTLVSGGDVYSSSSRSFLISEDNSRVVYTADQDPDGIYELFSVPIGGGASIKVSDTLVSGGNAGSPSISADSSRVVYRAEQDSDNITELYASYIDDIDGDGISDDEINVYETDPNVADSDGDGIDDGDELSYWGINWDTDYDGDGAIYQNNLLDDDSDGDGYVDGDELDAGADPSDPNSVPGASIPTLNEWGMITLMLMLMLAGMVVIRRKQEQ